MHIHKDLKNNKNYLNKNLENYSVQELDAREIQETDGGSLHNLLKR